MRQKLLIYLMVIIPLLGCRGYSEDMVESAEQLYSLRQKIVHTIDAATPSSEALQQAALASNSSLDREVVLAFGKLCLRSKDLDSEQISPNVLTFCELVYAHSFSGPEFETMAAQLLGLKLSDYAATSVECFCLFIHAEVPEVSKKHLMSEFTAAGGKGDLSVLRKKIDEAVKLVKGQRTPGSKGISNFCMLIYNELLRKK